MCTKEVPEPQFYVELTPQEPSETMIKLFGIHDALATVAFNVGFMNVVLRQSGCVLLDVDKVTISADHKTIIYECTSLFEKSHQLVLSTAKDKITVKSNFDPFEVIRRLVHYCKLSPAQFEYL